MYIYRKREREERRGSSFLFRRNLTILFLKEAVYGYSFAYLNSQQQNSGALDYNRIKLMNIYE